MFQQRILSLGTDLVSGGRCNRGQNHVALVKCRRELFLDLALCCACLLVVCVVVARRQHVGTQHDAALYLLAEALRTGLDVQIDEVIACVRGAVVYTRTLLLIP